MNDNYDREFDHAEMKAKTIWRIIVVCFVIAALLWYGTHR